MTRTLLVALTGLLSTPALATSPELLMFGTGDDHFTFAEVVEPGPDGDFYVAGRTLGSLARSADGPPGDGFVVRLSSEGEVLWAHQWGGDRSWEAVTAVAVHGDELVVALQNNGGSTGAAFGAPRYGSSIVRLSSDGHVVDSFTVPALIHDLDVGPQGDLVLAGRKVHVSSGMVDAWLARYTAQGEQRWRVFEHTRRTNDILEAVEWRGDLLVATGMSRHPVGVSEPAQGLVTEEGARGGVFTGAWSADGERLWAHTLVGHESGRGRDVVVDERGHTWVAAEIDVTYAIPNTWYAALLRYDPQGRMEQVAVMDGAEQWRGRDFVTRSPSGEIVWGVALHQLTRLQPGAQGQLALTVVDAQGRVGPTVQRDDLIIPAGLVYQGERAFLLGEACASTRFHTPGPMLQCDPTLRPVEL